MKRNVLTLYCIIVINLYVNAQNSWKQMKSMDTERYTAISFTISGKAYVGLGQMNNGSKVSDFWQYDPVTDIWTKKTDYPGIGSYAATAFAINGKGYVCLGQSNSGINGNDLWEYSPVTNSWKRMADFPGMARYGASAFVIGDTAFVGTGSYGNPNDYLYDMWMYVPSVNTWSKIANFPGLNRAHATAFSIGGYGYLGTGLSFKSTPTKDMWRYNKSNDSWSPIADFPGKARYGVISGVVGNKAYVGIGSDFATDFNDLYEYDPVKNNWGSQITSQAAFVVRCVPVTFTINDIIYIGTGIATKNRSILSDLWAYIPAEIDDIILPKMLVRCYDSAPLTIKAVDGFISYSWNTGETGSTIKDTGPGWYYVTVKTVLGALRTDSIEVKVSKPIVDLGKDRSICNPEILILDAGDLFTSYLWKTPQAILNTQKITTSLTGLYTIEATNQYGCKALDTIKLSFVDKPKLDLTKLETLMCGKFSTLLDVSADKDVSWSLQSTDPRVNINGLSVSVAPADQGKYPFILTAKDTFSCVSTAAFNLGFFKSPVVNLGNDSTICNPQSIALNAGNQFADYLWSTTEKTPSIIVKNNGIYSVSITDTNGCKTSDSVKIAFTEPPKMLNLSSVDTLICGKFSTTLNISSDKAVTYSLESSNPKVNITGLTASVVPADYGTYPITITAKDQFSCSSDTTFKIGFYKIPKVGFNVDDKTCSGYNLNVSYVGDADKSISNFDWIFGGAEIANQTGLNSLIVPLGINRSQRDLSLTVTENGCSNSYTLKNIKVIPNLDLHIVDALGCAPFTAEFIAENTEVVTYDWDFGDGTPVQRKDARPAHNYENPGYYDVKLRVTTVVPSGAGCYNEVRIDSFVHVAPVPAAAFSPLSDCLDAGIHQISYSGSGDALDRYIWDLKDFDSADIIQNPGETRGPLTFNLLSQPQANLGLKVISKYGCVSTPAATVIRRKPVFSLSSSTNAGCTPLELIFTGKVNDPVDKVSFNWDFGDGANGSGNNENHVYTTTDHQYDIILTALSSVTSCSDTIIKKGFVTTYPRPLAAFNLDHKIVYNDKPTINFSNASAGATSYSWDFGDGSISALSDPSHYFTAAGYRTVQLEAFNSFNCFDTISQQVIVAFDRIFPPNAFSPNAPNSVDRIFQLSSVGLQEEGYRLTILSRWGDIVFETRDEIKGWDGRMENGNYAAAGNYVWVLDFTDFLNRPHRQTGTVTLVF